MYNIKKRLETNLQLQNQQNMTCIFLFFFTKVGGWETLLHKG